MAIYVWSNLNKRRGLVAWGASLDRALMVTLREGPVEIIALGDTVLADGMPA